MKFNEPDITKRAESSPLWREASNQNGNVLPYLVERYLLLENWQYKNRLMDGEPHNTADDMQFVHLLIAEMATVLLDYEARIRTLETQINLHEGRLNNGIIDP